MQIKYAAEVLGKSALKSFSKTSSYDGDMGVSTVLLVACVTPVNDSSPTSWNPPTAILVEKSQEIDSVSEMQEERCIFLPLVFSPSK